MQRQTTIAKANEIQRKWYVIDATDKPLGRLCSYVAQVLTGKVKPTWTPNVDCGDYVIIINAEKVGLSGNKLETKKYYNVPKVPGRRRGKRGFPAAPRERPREPFFNASRGPSPLP